MKIFDPENERLDRAFDYNKSETEDLKAGTYGQVTLDELRRFALWKLNRVVEVPDAVIAELHRIAKQPDLTCRDELACRTITALVACEGIGFPMASTFLKFIRPDVFPIIDVRAYRALTGRRVRHAQYSLPIYLDYVDRLQAIARCRTVPLALVDEQLYCFDREFNGPIDGKASDRHAA